MAITTTMVALAGLAVASYAAYEQHQAVKEQSRAFAAQGRAQKNQFDAEQRRADIANARQIRQAVRQARIARANVINSGANSGSLWSSGVAGGASSVAAQHGGNLTYFNQMQGANQQALAAQAAQGAAATQGAVAQADGAAWGAFGALGGSVFAGAGGFRTIFDS